MGCPILRARRGEERFYSDDGRPIYPPNNGAVDKEEKTLLPKGTVISRYGGNAGKYASPEGTAMEARALSKQTREQNDLHTFVLEKDVECLQSEVAPWLGQEGRGVQYRLQSSIESMLKRGELSEK